MATIFVITGGTGFIGQHFVKQVIDQGSKVYILSRKKIKSTVDQIQYIQWDPSKNFLEKNIEESNVCVVHLAGANVAGKRWNEKAKKELLDSRTQSTDFLYRLLQEKKIKAAQIVSASAIGYYAANSIALQETDAAGSDFLSSICVAWEKSVTSLRNLHIPVAILRIGIVMGKGGGAAAEFMKTIKFGIAGLPAGGQQIYSWIHVQDVCNMILHCEKNKLNDVYNAVSPQPTTCKQLVQHLASAYSSWHICVPVPGFVIKILLGEMSTEVLKSAMVSSKKIQETSFNFQYPTYPEAMIQIAKAYKK
jgi:uncharacterized protein